QQRYRTTLCHDSRPAYGNLAFLGTVVTCNYLIFHAVHLPSPLRAAGVLHVYATVQDNIIMLQNKRYLFYFVSLCHMRRKAICDTLFGARTRHAVGANTDMLDQGVFT